MSDLQPTQPETLFQLRKPLKLVDIVRNDMGEPAEYLFARPDGSETELIGCGEDYVKRVFEPLDVESLQTQLKMLLMDIYFEGKNDALDNQTVTPDWFNQPIAEILALFGLENKETD